MLAGSTRLRNINHITYNVKNKDAALKWYQEVLGLKQIPKMVNSDHLYWLQLPSGAMVHIIENADAPSAPSHHTAFEVEDLDAAHKQLGEMGNECNEIPTRTAGQRAMYPNDPDANRISPFTNSGLGSRVSAGSPSLTLLLGKEAALPPSLGLTGVGKLMRCYTSVAQKAMLF